MKREKVKIGFRPLFLLLVLGLGGLPMGGGSAPAEAWADELRSQAIRGVFGVPSVAGLPEAGREALLKKLQGLDAVFVPPETETIKFFKARGFKVYLTANAFGGREAWRRYPDARPILADGRTLEEAEPGGHGGVCPTHEAWQAERLAMIADWVRRFGGPGGIDGIWLDFIRYPGFWETAEQRVPPDGCYCPRCLAKFSRDRGIALPAAAGGKAMGAAEAAAWIRRHHLYEWTAWKKEQIVSFVRDVRGIVKDKSTVPILLGAFIVPWTKGERDGAVSFLLGQDAFELSGIVDVIVPMLYHRMVGRSVDWVGRMTAYYRETSQGNLWPILQAGDLDAGEFAEAVRQATLGDADGLLAFSFRQLDEGKRRALAGFTPPPNLIPDPDFLTAEAVTASPAPYGPRYEVRSSADLPGGGKAGPGTRFAPFRTLGILGGASTPGQWQVPLPPCEPGQTYRFSALFHRNTERELSRTTISIWGEAFLLEKHLPEAFQPIRVSLTCPDPKASVDRTFRFTNEGNRDVFYLAKPRLVRSIPSPAPEPALNNGLPYPGFFPIGIYGAGRDDLEAVRRLAINTVFIGGEGSRLEEAIAACQGQGLHYLLMTPQEPEKLKVYLDRLAQVPGIADSGLLAFYLDDEPEMRAVPTGRSEDLQRLVKGRFPGAATAMATVRPSYCREYLKGADFFMLDQYPFPNMPMSWLGDAMDRAAREAGRDRLLSVIQAFSDGDHWPSMPGWRQMDCLAFLSIVHGSRGIFFFTWSSIGKTPEGRQSLGRVVGRLNKIYPWLLEKNLDRPVEVQMLSEYRVDPKGRPAVQTCLKKKGEETMLIAVNTVGAPVEALLKMGDSEPGGKGTSRGPKAAEAAVSGPAREAFSEDLYPVEQGAIRLTLQAYETKAFILNHP